MTEKLKFLIDFSVSDYFDIFSMARKNEAKINKNKFRECGLIGAVKDLKRKKQVGRIVWGEEKRSADISYCDKNGEKRVLKIGLNNFKSEGDKPTIMFKTKNGEGQVDEYIVRGISPTNAENCLSRAMEIQNCEGTEAINSRYNIPARDILVECDSSFYKN